VVARQFRLQVFELLIAPMVAGFGDQLGGRVDVSGGAGTVWRGLREEQARLFQVVVGEKELRSAARGEGPNFCFIRSSLAWVADHILRRDFTQVHTRIVSQALTTSQTTIMRISASRGTSLRSSLESRASWGPPITTAINKPGKSRMGMIADTSTGAGESPKMIKVGFAWTTRLVEPAWECLVVRYNR